VYPVVTEQNRGKIKMKELSVQEQTTVTGGMSWEIAAMVLGLGGAILTAGGTAAAVGVAAITLGIALSPK